MNDKMTKFLLLLIAIGLFLNAAALLTNTLTTPAYAADSRMYIEGGKLEITIADFPSYDKLLVKIEDTVKVDEQ